MEPNLSNKHTHPTGILLVHTDGSSRVHKNSYGRAGWAYVITLNGNTVKEDSGSYPWTTANRMELLAVINAIKYVRDNYSNADMRVFSHSTYVFKKGIRSSVNDSFPPYDLHKQLYLLLNSPNLKGKISWENISNDGCYLHDKADKLAKQASFKEKDIRLWSLIENALKDEN